MACECGHKPKHTALNKIDPNPLAPIPQPAVLVEAIPNVFENKRLHHRALVDTDIIQNEALHLNGMPSARTSSLLDKTLNHCHV